MGSEEQALTRRLRTHVEQLAGKIGERNVFCPTALRAAASYIEHEWEQQGYAVRWLAHDVSGVRVPGLPFAQCVRTEHPKFCLIRGVAPGDIEVRSILSEGHIESVTLDTLTRAALAVRTRMRN